MLGLPRGAALVALGLCFGLALPLLAAQPAQQKSQVRAVQQAQPTQPGQSTQPEPGPQAAFDPRRTPVVRVVQEVGPAVVSVVSLRESESKTPFAGDSFMQRLLGDSQSNATAPKTTSKNLGSGVIIDGRKGYVLTNAHVIGGGTKITTRLEDGREYAATLLGADQDMDLAVLRLNLPPGAEPLPQVRMGDSASLMIGEPLIAIGNPYGLSHTVTTGVVSALDRSMNTGQQSFTGLIQTDAAINPGNSGGPLLNILGEVVGINAAVFAKGGGLGFAIPINKAKRVLDELITTGRVAHIWLGLLGENLTPELVAQFGLARPGGMVVTEVFPGTPADKVGIRTGDALLAIGGQKVQDKGQFLGLLLNYTKADTLDVYLSRGRAPYQVKLRPQELDQEAGLGLINWRWGFTPAVPAASGKSESPASKAVVGVAVGSVRPGGPAARLGVKPGDLILQVGNMRSGNMPDLLSAFSRYQMHNNLLLTVHRDGKIYTVRMKI